MDMERLLEEDAVKEDDEVKRRLLEEDAVEEDDEVKSASKNFLLDRVLFEG